MNRLDSILVIPLLRYTRHRSKLFSAQQSIGPFAEVVGEKRMVICFYFGIAVPLLPPQHVT